ncbi:MAG: hypothetical protein ACOX41_03295 [Anaerovoracaceae bacterium]|jgi:hypothetical protein
MTANKRDSALPTKDRFEAAAASESKSGSAPEAAAKAAQRSIRAAESRKAGIDGSAVDDRTAGAAGREPGSEPPLGFHYSASTAALAAVTRRTRQLGEEREEDLRRTEEAAERARQTAVAEGEE